MKTVFIFGAGASAETGAPVMANFLDKAHLIRNKIKDEEERIAFEEVFTTIAELQSIHFRSYLDLNNIEVVFSAIEMARIIGRLGDLKPETISKVHKSIIALIVKTLEDTIEYPTDNGQVIPPSFYTRLADLLTQPIREGHSVAFITFNYDYILDFTLNYKGIPYNYFLKENSSLTPLLKLHGSLNWYKCNNVYCDSKEVVIRDLAEFIPRSNIRDIPEFAKSSASEEKIHFSLKFLDSPMCPKCNSNLENSPLLIPPTWNKTGNHDEIKPVWEKAAEVLAEAENIFVIGYSVPETDLFFKYLFALSAKSTTWLRKFRVINIDKSIDSHFEDIISKGIKQRYKSYPYKFSESLDMISTIIRNPDSLY